MLDSNHIDYTKIYVVDEVNQDFIVCEELNSKEILQYKLDELLFTPREGDVLKFKDGTLIRDRKETKRRKKYIEKIFNDLFK